MRLFDEIVLFLGRKRSAPQLAEAIGVESLDGARLGMILSASAVVANIARLVEIPAHAAWLTARINASRSSAVDLRSLQFDLDLDRMGLELLNRGDQPSSDHIAERIAAQAAIPLTSANAVLKTTAATALVCMGAKYPPEIAPETLLADLGQDRLDLMDKGWKPWIDEVESLAAKTPAAARAAYPPPDRTVRTRPVESAHATGGAVYPAAAAAGAAQNGADFHELPDDRDNRRSIAVKIAAGLATLAVLVAAVLISQRGNGEPTEAIELQDAAQTESSESSDDPAATPSAPSVTPSADGEEAAPADERVVSLMVPLTDPLGNTEGTGEAHLTFDRETGEICYDFKVDGVGYPYDGHIHVGPAGVKGGIVVDFGELRSTTTGCLAGSAIDIEAILADLGGHYVEFHDPDDISTIRAQLEYEGQASAPSTDAEDGGPENDGAVIVIESGALVLRGPVPDQVTIDKLIESFADIELGATKLVTELEIVEGAPRPSGTILVDEAILFATGSDQLSDPQSTVLNDLATIFKARPAWRMTIVGHTDSVGTDVLNLELSLRRASAIRDALVAAGVPEQVLTTRGAGATDPVADNGTPEGRALNRRIEIIVIPG